MKRSIALLILASAATLVAQEPASDTTFSLRQEVRNVVLDVVVTDKHGQPVKDLQGSAFQVLENGVAQQIALFEHHMAGEQAAPAPAAAAPALPPDTHSNTRPRMPAGPLLVLLLDAMNTPVAEQSYVRSQAIEYLKHLPANTKMAIFVLGNDLRMLQNFTSDPAILKAALDGRAYPSYVANVNTELINADHVAQLNGAGASAPVGAAGSAPFGMGEAVSSVRASLEHFSNTRDLGQEARVRYTLDTLNALSIYLSGLPGRKNLVWFTSSIPWTINPDFSLVFATTGRQDYAEALKRLANRMEEGRISIYPVDAHVLAGPSGYDPSGGGNIVGAGSAGPVSGSAHGAATGGDFAANDMAEQMNAAGEHLSMQNLANATGGRAIYNTNGLSEAIQKVDALNEDYYTLAYSPSDKREDGSFRKIEIKLSRPGLKLEYRRGYYAENPASLVKHDQLISSNPVHMLMQHDAPDATQVLFRIQNKLAATQPDPARPASRVGAQAASLSGPLVRYEFHWNVDLATVNFREASGWHHGELDAALTAYDAQGKVLNSIYSTLPLNLSDAQFDGFRNSGLPMKQALDLPPGTVSLRAAVIDPTSGRTGATEFPLVVKLN